jgi:hypothetical protein
MFFFEYQMSISCIDGLIVLYLTLLENNVEYYITHKNE